jgi:hypothetical protein
MSIPADFKHSIVPAVTGEAALYQIIGNNDPAGHTWKGQ